MEATYHKESVEAAEGGQVDNAQGEVEDGGEEGAEGTPRQRQGHHGVDDDDRDDRATVVRQLRHTRIVQLQAEH